MDEFSSRARSAGKTCPFLTAKQAAFHLGLATRTLRAMRAGDGGPRCRLHGRTWRYHIDDIEAWSNSRVRGGKRA